MPNVLSFAPAAAAPGYHTIEVRLVRHPDFTIRARPGYWATEQPQPTYNLVECLSILLS